MSAIYEALGQLQQAQRTAVMQLDDECQHLDTHTEQVELDQGPEETSLYEYDVEVCNHCDEVVS